MHPRARLPLKPSLATLLAAVLALGVLSSPVRAASVYWTNSAGGNYTNAVNWSNAVPSIADQAFFTNAGVAYTVTVGNTLTNGNLTFSGNGATVVLNAAGNTLWSTNTLSVNATDAGSDSTLVLAGGTFMATNAVGSLGAGGGLGVGTTSGRRGTVMVSNGSLNVAYAKVGGGTAGALGTLYIFGGTNDLNTKAGDPNAFFSVGNSSSGGTGVFLLAGGSYQGAIVYATNQNTYVGGVGVTSTGVGFFTVSNGTYFGKGASIAYAGGAQGTMNLFGGSNIFSGAMTVGGGNGAGTGTVLMAGSSPVLSVSSLVLGNAANSLGTMTISNGTFISSATLKLGDASGANGTLNIYGGTNSASGIVTVGSAASGLGTLNIFGGSNTFSTTVKVGDGTSSSGTLTITNGSLTSGLLSVAQGTGSTGTVVVSGGNVVSSGTSLMGLNGGTAVATLTISNGTLTTGIMSLNNKAQYTIVGGTNRGTARFDVAVNSADTANMLMTGGQLVLTNTTAGNGSFRIGVAGKGTFDMQGGSTLIRDVNVGDLTAGTVGQWNITGGTNTIVSGGSFEIARSSGTTGTVVLAGGQLNVNAASLNVGTIGNGTLTVMSNATLNAGTVTLGNSGGAGNVGTWNIYGGTNTLTGNIAMGRVNNSIATLLMTGGVLNVAGAFSIGQQTYSGATATLSNGTLTANQLSVGGDSSGTAAGEGKLFLYGGLTVVTNTGATSFSVGARRSGDTGMVLVANSAILELQGSTMIGASGSFLGNVTNRDGGTIRFTGMNNPTITVAAGSSFVTTNATLEFMNAGAVQTNAFGKMTLQGSNTLSLLNSTNATLPSYVFSNNLAFSTLRLMGAAPTWQSTNLLIGAGGTLLISNAGNATIQGVVSNQGTINVMNSRVTYAAPVVISGLYRSDPSTNTFTTNVTVTASGALSGSNGDLFVFGGNLLNQSTNRSGFNLWQASVLFTNLSAGVTNHTYNVAGSASVNFGTGFTNMDRVSTNFAIGTLSIAAGNRLTLTGSVFSVAEGGDGRSNAVYVGWLDIQGLTLNSTNTQQHVFDTLTAALDLQGINLYYSREDPNNAWLNEFIPDTGYALWGSGLLLPIPEPSPFLAVGAGLTLLAFLRRRRA